MNVIQGQLDSKDEQKFLSINIDSHICRKILCADCFQQNQDETSRSQAIKLKQFLEKSNLILLQLNDKKQIDIMFKDLKEKVNEIESIYKKLAEKFVQNMTIFKKNLKESNIGLDIMKEKLSEDKIESLLKIELQILDHASLCAQIATKLSHFERAANQVHDIYEQLKEFSVNSDINVKQENLVIQTSYVRQNYFQKSQEDVIQLIGQKHLNMLHGDFFYKINNIQVRKAGEYRFNQKVGFWLDIENNIEQCGEYLNGKRIGIWQFSINSIIIAKCQYNQDGQKHGQWIDICSNSNKMSCQFIFIGEYDKGKRVGKWKIKQKFGDLLEYKNNGGGNYDQNGNKDGYWEDINESCSNLQLYFGFVWVGHYQRGIRVGEWIIKYLLPLRIPFTRIGGNYDNSGKKVGFWIEFTEDYFVDSEILWEGQYQDDFRVGEWKIKFSDLSEKNYFGGGNYDERGKKIGQWVDVNEQYFSPYKQIIWQGKYVNGRPVGEWKLKFRKNSEEPFSQIGGGNFDLIGNKIGGWLEIDKSYKKSKIIWKGQYQSGIQVGEWKIKDQNCQSKFLTQYGGGKYDQSGKKVGKWVDIKKISVIGNIIWEGQYLGNLRVGEWKIKHQESVQFNQIGGGKFDQTGIKVGQWIEIVKRKYCRNQQLISKGNYKGGLRVGEWKIQFRDYSSEPFTNIGGGMYSQNGNKIGKWLDIDESQFNIFVQAILEGSYQNGLKVGEWKMLSRFDSFQPFIQIGGGQYDQSGTKVGHWIDVNDFRKNQIIWEGLYEQGRRVGEWKIKYRLESFQEFSEIGGGTYDQFGTKVGKWVDISQYFGNDTQIVWEGQYNEGIRVGEWRIKFCLQQADSFSQIGGGFYDQNGNKTGNWVKITNRYFTSDAQVIWQGTYESGLKIGDWKIKYREPGLLKPFAEIGGGKFDQNGNKVGYWIDIDGYEFKKDQQAILEGNYQEGLKVGEWKISYREDSSKQFTQIGGGMYNQNGNKIGKWIEIEFEIIELYSDGRNIRPLEKEYGNGQIE